VAVLALPFAIALAICTRKGDVPAAVIVAARGRQRDSAASSESVSLKWNGVDLSTRYRAETLK
jgi:hypothetical protein